MALCLWSCQTCTQQVWWCMIDDVLYNPGKLLQAQDLLAITWAALATTVRPNNHTITSAAAPQAAEGNAPYAARDGVRGSLQCTARLRHQHMQGCSPASSTSRVTMLACTLVAETAAVYEACLL